MLHKISQFCDKINSINKMAEDLRVLKYQTLNQMNEIFKIQNLIETIQADCLLLPMIKMIMKKAIMIILVLTMTTACSVKKNKNEKKYNPIYSIIRTIVGVPDKL